MARNQHLFTVYHSLENKGAFDRPDASQQIEADNVQGKYFQEHTEYPKYVHAKGHVSVIVANPEEEATVIKLWADEAVAKEKAAQIHSKNETEINRAELSDRAKKLGLKVDGRTSDKKIAYLIEEAELANEAKVA